MPRLSTSERVERAKAARDQAEAQLRQATAQMRKEGRRQDTRRKIVLGGALLRMAGSNPTWHEGLKRLIRSLPERDRKLFEGLDLPAPSALETPKDQPGAKGTSST